MTAPHGDSTDGFVFPPFVPASSRPADAPAPPPASGQPPAPAPAPAESAGRMTMPWDVETPVVREQDAPAAESDAPAAEAETEEDGGGGEDLPWLEVPTPRDDAPAEAPADAPAAAEAFPDWMAWDARDEDQAEAEARGVEPVAGLEDAETMGGFGDLSAPAGSEPAVDDQGLELAPEFDTPGGFEPAAEPALAEDGDEGEFGSPAAAAAEAESAFPDAGLRPADADEPDDFTAAAIAAAEAESPAEPAAVDAADEAAPGVFDEVAARLEDIARTLRDRPDALFSGTESDPLSLLVAGFVLGYRQGRG